MLRNCSRAIAGSLLLAGLSLVSPGRAAAQSAAGQPQTPAPRATAADTNIDVSLARIRRQLREIPPTHAPGTPSLLKLDYYVEVVGESPTVDFFKEFNIGRASSVQYGGMTHDEFLRVTAPFWRKTW